MSRCEDRWYDVKSDRDDLVNAWRATDVVSVDGHVIRSHRAPREPRRVRDTFVAVVSLALLASAVNVVYRSDGRSYSSGMFVAGDDARVSDPDVDARERTRERARASRDLTLTRGVSRYVAPINNGCISRPWYSSDLARHEGVDVAARRNAAVRAMADGVIVQVGASYRGFDDSIVIAHSDGHMSLYGHVSRSTVHVGQRVRAGDVIARVGISHVHIGIARTDVLTEIWSTWIDPSEWLRAHDASVVACT